MEGQGLGDLSDYEYHDAIDADAENGILEDIDDLYSRQEAYEEDESRIDEDLEPEFREGDNKECL